MSGTTSGRPFHNEGEKMRKIGTMLLVGLGFCLLAPAAFAQAPGATSPTSLIVITSGIAYAIAVFGCAFAQGKATAAACEGLARNPGAAAAIRLALILGLVFIESLSLYTFAVLYLKL
jgi:F-type H+-transporting ATPase subunit c